MTALALRGDPRHGYRRQVERLLERIREETHAIQLLKVAGVRGQVIAERVSELEQVRERLAALVASRP
jgi:hypothetical protein